jgi:hypothetical protein
MLLAEIRLFSITRPRGIFGKEAIPLLFQNSHRRLVEARSPAIAVSKACHCTVSLCARSVNVEPIGRKSCSTALETSLPIGCGVPLPWSAV